MIFLGGDSDPPGHWSWEILSWIQRHTKIRGGPRPKKFRGDLNFKGGAMTLHDTMVQSFEDIF